jgi:hypothetical protein
VSNWWSSTPWWSVRFALEDGEAGPLSMLVHTRSDIRAWSIGRGPYGDEGEPDALTLELSAPDATTARVTAQDLTGRWRRDAGFGNDAPEIVWVARMDSQPESSMRFLSEAWDALGEEHLEWAVIAAQTHLEVHTRVLVEASASASPSPPADALLAMKGPWEPAKPHVRQVLEALWRVDFKNDCPKWGPYNAHLARRNAIVHGGQAIEEAEARESVETVVAVWQWLNGVAK